MTNELAIRILTGDVLGTSEQTHEAVTMAVRALSQPSAQPKIIHCGDCRYKDDGIDEDGIPFLKCLNGRSYGGTRINDFCSWAKRKDNDTVD